MNAPSSAGSLYTYGADEWILVQFSESMSLDVAIKALTLSRYLGSQNLRGVKEICVANASYMVRVDPDEVRPDELVEELKRIETEVVDYFSVPITTRIVDVPILFEDEWTAAAVQQFRHAHHRPDLTDLEFAAEINGFDTTDALIDAIVSAPAIMTTIGFVPGAAGGYQLVPEGQQIEVPKYIRPRTFTPERTFGWGGSTTVVYPVAGAGGYQMFGICASPMVEFAQTLPDFRDGYTFPRAGDLHNYRKVDRDEYDSIRRQVEEGSFRYRLAEVEFNPADWSESPTQTVAAMRGELYDA